MRRSVHPLAFSFFILLVLALPTFVSAQPFGSYLRFQGSPDHGYVSIPHAAALTPASAMTIEGWFYFAAANTGEDCRTLVGKDWTSSYWVGVCNQSLRSYLRGSASQRNGGKLYLNSWNHFAVVFDGTMRRHYVNGDLTLEVAEPGGPLPSSTSALRIGSDVQWQYSPTGDLDEVRLWSVARSAAQIRETINRRLDSAPGLVASWHLDGNGADAVGSHPGTVSGAVVPWTNPVGTCTSNSTTLCLGSGRYAVTVDWRLSDGSGGTGKVVPGAAADSGLFWFFAATNWELMVKVLDGCSVNSRKWAFSAATTNVGYTLAVTDMTRGETKRYINPLNVSASAVTDTDAFPFCP
jgi:hypothetical protein